MRPAEQRSCTRASSSCINTAGPHGNKPRQSKQLMHAAKASVALNSAIASAATPANPAAAVHTACSPLGSAAASTHLDHVHTPELHAKTSRSAANSSCTRQKPRSCLIRQLPAPSHLRIQRQLCVHHTPHRAVPLHPRILITFKHRSCARKQAAAEQTAHARGKSLGRA